MARKVAAASKAPAFTLPCDGGGKVSLADFKGRKLVLYFYPKADTAGCTLEAKDFSRLGAAFATRRNRRSWAYRPIRCKAGQVQGQARPDDRARLRRDPRDARGLRGLGREIACMAASYMGILRNTYLIGPDGKIARIWEKVKVDGHAEEVLAAAKAL